MSVVQFTGLASGIDSASLIKALIDSERKVRIEPLTKKISSIKDQNDSLAKLTELLNTLKDAADKFRTVNGSAIAKTVSSSNEAVATGTATNSAISGTYSVAVTQKAQGSAVSFNDRFSSTDSIINASINNGAAAANRTASITIGTGSNQETINIELTNTTTASQFVNSYNSSATKSVASLVNVGTTSSPSYAILVQSNELGLEKGEVALSIGSEITGAGSGAFSANTTSQATNAQFTVSGITGSISRASNSVSDVLSGVTLSLEGTGSSTVTVSNDQSETSSVLQEFVDAFNEVVQYVKENDLVTRDANDPTSEAIFGALSGTELDENVLYSLRSSISGAGLSGGTLNSLADLGITTERDGTLKLNTQTLDSALSLDPDRVREITESLGNALGGVEGTVAQYTKFAGLIDTTENLNSSEINSLNSRIIDIESSISKQESTLNARYARLESIISNLTFQQSALTNIGKGL